VRKRLHGHSPRHPKGETLFLKQKTTTLFEVDCFGSHMQANRYAMNKGWLAIRVGFGLNGVIVHVNDLDYLSGYLMRHQQRRPPDHLLVEWFLGDSQERFQKKNHT
jgi:hypothetical protein